MKDNKQIVEYLYASIERCDKYLSMYKDTKGIDRNISDIYNFWLGNKIACINTLYYMGIDLLKDIG